MIEFDVCQREHTRQVGYAYRDGRDVRHYPTRLPINAHLFQLEPVPASQALNPSGSAEEEEHASSDSDSHSYLDGNVSNAAPSDREGSSDEEENSSSEEDQEQSNDSSGADNNDNDHERDESDAETGDSDEESSGSQFSASTDHSELRRLSRRTRAPKAHGEVDDQAQVKLKCPLCFEDKSDLSCGRCGHVFCTP